MYLVGFARVVEEIGQCRPSFVARVLGINPVEGGASHPIGGQSGAFKLTSSGSMKRSFLPESSSLKGFFQSVFAKPVSHLSK
jgi:hypothetical protein